MHVNEVEEIKGHHVTMCSRMIEETEPGSVLITDSIQTKIESPNIQAIKSSKFAQKLPEHKQNSNNKLLQSGSKGRRIFI